MNESLTTAIRIIGGQTALAKALSKLCGKQIWQGHITAWLHRNKKGVPAEFCIPIEELTGGKVRREDLRPDIFGRGRG